MKVMMNYLIFYFLVHLTTRFLVTCAVKDNAVIQLIKNYNAKNTHTKFELKLWSRSEAINVLADCL